MSRRFVCPRGLRNALVYEGKLRRLPSYLLQISDHGIHFIAWIMIGVSLGLTLLTLADRTLRTRPVQPTQSSS